MSAPRKLNVFRGAELVGTLHDENPLRFIYADSWLKKPGASSIEPDLDLAEAIHAGPAVEVFFENLLPEANIRELLKIKYQVTTVFGLLSAIGGDTAGDLSLLPEGESPVSPEYQDASWEEVASLFAYPTAAANLGQYAEGMRISLAGAQRKTSLYIRADGTPALPLASSPSTHIVKPDINGIEGVWASALNETLVMKLASAAGIGAAEVEYQPIAKACLVKRYDRILHSDGSITKLHQLDLCQLDGKLSTIKYESDGGPTLARCRQILGENGVPASDIKRLVQWVFFNLFVGNNDSHAKNLSIYYPPGEGARLTPFYDLLSTSLYPGLSRKFAFRIGGGNQPGKIDGECVARMAKELGVKSKYALGIADEMAAGILNCVNDVSGELMRVAQPGTEQTLLERLSQHVTNNTRKAHARMA